MPDKIKTRAQLEKIIQRLKKQGRKIAFTNGCFDILHYGHVKYLEDAKAKADILAVGLNSDASIRRIKGASRPINRQAGRARILEALSAVDYITIFNEDTPLKLIQLLKPDILIKGRDWSVRKIVGADFIRASGGSVVTVPYLKGYSTTGLIEKIKNNC